MNSEIDELEEEIRELLKNYKNPRITVEVPCTKNNFKDCLIALNEELAAVNIEYTFNPYTDVDGNKLNSKALVNLVNATYTLLYKYKNEVDKAKMISENNHSLETTNKQLNIKIKNLNDKLKNEKNESRACVASAQRISDKSENIHSEFSNAKAKLTQVNKQMISKERNYAAEISRLKLENEKLREKLRSKSGGAILCVDACQESKEQILEREKRQRTLISKLEHNNRMLVEEVINLKHELVFSGLKE